MEPIAQQPHTSQDAVIAGKLEALLFVHGEPMAISTLAQFLKINVEDVQRASKYMKTLCAETGRGITILEHEETLQLVTKQEFADILTSLTKETMKEELTPATLETLSIIAYAGPLTRTEVEYIRGVNSSFTVRNLLIRGLIERKLDPKRQNTYLYFVSADFLKHIGLTSIEELPEYTRYHDLRKTFDTTHHHEGNTSN